MTVRLLAFALSCSLVAAACGDDGGGTTVDARPTIDASGATDAPVVDAPVSIDANDVDAITDDAMVTDASADADTTDADTTDGSTLVAPIINEAVKSHDGANNMEYIEIFGTPNTDYSAFTVLQIDGDTGMNVNPGRVVTAHPVGTTDANGYWWTGYMSTQLENGAQTLLLVHDFDGTAGTSDIDTSDDGTIDATFWTAILDAVAFDDAVGTNHLYAGLAIVVADSATNGGGASRIPNGVDTNAAADWTKNVFDMAATPAVGEAFNTPGTANMAN